MRASSLSSSLFPLAPTPVVTALPHEVLALAAKLLADGNACAMATVLSRAGSTPATPGQKLLLSDTGFAAGTVGGGALEKQVLAALRALIEAGSAARLQQFRLGPELGMCCGGQVEIMMEPLVSLTPCYLVGAGHVARALAPILVQAGFAVQVTDAREEWAHPVVVGSEQLNVGLGEFDELGKDVPRTAAVLVMSHDHQLDSAVLEWALRERFALVGGVGSRAKAERSKQRLLHKGFSKDDVARIRMPFGIDIGARSPGEIAVSMAAELVAWKRLHQKASLPATDPP
jgi:xanthine dehydrogenase accessory factor